MPTKVTAPQAALFSLGASRRLILASESSSDVTLLKMSALLYPSVIVNAIHGPFLSIRDFVADGLSRYQKGKVDRMLVPISNYVKDYRFSILDLLTEISKDTEIDLEKVHSHIANIMPDLTKPRSPVAPSILTGGKDRKANPDPLFILYLKRLTGQAYFDGFEMQNVVSSFLGTAGIASRLESKIHVAIPDIEQLSWSEIVDLRSHKNITAFRRYLLDHKGDPADLERDIYRSDALLWHDRAPRSLLEVAVAKMLAWVPGFGLAQDAANFTQDFSDSRKAGWFFFVQDARYESVAKEEIKQRIERPNPVKYY